MIRRRKVSCKVDVNYLSECCDSSPSGELDETIHGITGFCSRCKDNAIFYDEVYTNKMYANPAIERDDTESSK